MLKKSLFLLAIVFAAGTAVFVFTNKQAHSTVKFIHKRPVDEKLAFKRGDIEVSNEEFMKEIKFDIFRAEMGIFNIKMGRMKSILMKTLMDKDLRKKGLSNDEYLEKYIANKVDVSPKEIDDFAKKNNIPKVDDTLKGRIRSYLLNDKKKTAISQWLDRQFEQTPVEVYFEKPERPIFDVSVGDSPFVGGANAKVTIVEFSDFQCPFCARALEKVDQLKKKYGNKIKIVFKNFPLPSHANAPLAARAGLCAQKLKGNESFWKLHDKIFANQAALGRSDLVKYSGEMGLNEKAFEDCLDSEDIRKRVEADLEQGKGLGVQSTPTFYINGRPVQGNQGLETFIEIIDNLL